MLLVIINILFLLNLQIIGKNAGQTGLLILIGNQSMQKNWIQKALEIHLEKYESTSLPLIAKVKFF